jgi:osmoprotectant transport system permease protein
MYFHGPCVFDAMNLLHAALTYIQQNPGPFKDAVRVHLQLSLTAVIVAVIVCFPLGVLASRSRLVSLYSLNAFGVARAVPSVAVLFVFYPYLGLGFHPALVALTLLACPPILINTNIGFREVDPALREAAYGMGMNTWQVLSRIEFPLALPVVIAGLRTATVEVIASAALATFIGVNDLGTFIYEGLSNFQNEVMLVGAIPVALLALLAEVVLSGAERYSRRLSG